MDIFKVLPDGTVEFEEDFIFQIPELRKIRKRVVTCKGDHDGRKKVRNYQELMYVFYMGDWTEKNVYREITNLDERSDKARIAAKLPIEWTPDEDVQTAIKVYADILISSDSSVNLLMSLLEANNLNIELVKQRMATNRTLTESLNELSKVAIDSGSIETKAKMLSDIAAVRSQLSSNIKEDSALVKILAKDMAMIDELKTKVSAAANKLRKTSDGGFVYNREIPRNVIN